MLVRREAGLVPTRRDGSAPLDPFSAAALAESVVTVLSALGGPIAAVVKRRLVKRKVRKSIERVSSNFVAEHPATADAMAESAEVIAHELARLAGAGRPANAQTLADRWAATGRLSQGEATQYADEYVQRLHDELVKIDGFRSLFVAGANITAAEKLQLISESMRRSEASVRAREEWEIAALYYEAAKAYFQAALALIAGDTIKAMGYEYDAHSLIDKARLGRASLALVNSKSVRERFAELVEDRFEDAEVACASGDYAKAQEAVRALDEGCDEFRALVNERLRAI
jgi:hypothetical protein